MNSMMSSQEFRNAYEKFYSRIREYLWPISVLEMLADVEVDIYSAFIDYKKLDSHLIKLGSAIRDVMQDDEYLQKEYDALNDLVQESLQEDIQSYLKLYQVQEVDPELNKTIKLSSEEDISDEDNKETAGQGI